MRVPVLSAVLLAGCAATPDAAPFVLWGHFPFDGERTWEFVSSDVSVTEKLTLQLRPDPMDADGANAYTVEHSLDGDVVRTVAWSSDVSRGTLIHELEHDGLARQLDPPVVVAPREVYIGASTETINEHGRWTSTFVGFEPCEDVVYTVIEGAERANCAAHFELAVDDGTGVEVAGHLWVARGIGFLGLDLDADQAAWKLSGSTCAGDCDGQW